jgi:hypothetical protein
VVEGARLESVYTSKGYRGFESLSLRITVFTRKPLTIVSGFLFLIAMCKYGMHHLQLTCTSFILIQMPFYRIARFNNHRSMLEKNGHL